MTTGAEICYESPVLGMRLALDPGSHKCGWAIECQLTHSPLIGVSHIEKLESFLQEASCFFAIATVIVGDGTGSARVIEIVRHSLPGAEVAVIDEHGSTEEALKLYLQTRGGGMLRYLYAQIFRPPLDGYAAWVLLMRHSRKL